MTIYKSTVTSEKSKSAVEHEKGHYVDDAEDDNPFAVDDTDRIIYSQPVHSRRQRNVTALKCFIVLCTLFLALMTVFGTVYFYRRASGHDNKPWVELCRVRYHEWKTGASGKDKSFLMEGEFYQQVEIDHVQERYEKLNIPPVLNTRRASVLHDMEQGLTAIIDQDHGRCFIMQINATLVKPISDFSELVQYNKAGYYLPDAELVRDNYQLVMPAIDDISQFGSRIYSYCQFFDTYRLVRDDTMLNVSVESRPTSCHYQGEQYCLGNAGSKYMLICIISRCVGAK